MSSGDLSTSVAGIRTTSMPCDLSQSRAITFGAVTDIVRNAVDFDADLRLGAIKIENEVTDGVLAAKLRAIGAVA